MKRIIIILIVLFSSSSFIYPQSIGIVYEATSFNLNNLYFQNPNTYNGMIKNLFINFNNSLYTNLEMSLRIGYGWNKYEEKYGDLVSQTVTNEVNTDGYPIEIEIKYKHIIVEGSVFEPIIGIGVGYYNYTTTLKNSYSTTSPEFKTKGFGQYITFGMNVNISKDITSSIQFKKIMINSISTKDDGGWEKDYIQGTGINDLSICLGIFYNINN